MSHISPTVLAKLAAMPAAPMFVAWIRTLNPSENPDLIRFLKTGDHIDPGPVWHQLDEALRWHPPRDMMAVDMARTVLNLLAAHDGRHPQDDSHGEIGECAAGGDHPPE